MASLNPAFGISNIELNDDLISALSTLHANVIPYLNTINQSLSTTSSPLFATISVGTSSIKTTMQNNPLSIANHTVTMPTHDLDLDTILVAKSSAVPPLVTDDTYLVGTTWVDTTADQPYICVDKTTGSAVWRKLIFDGISVINAGSLVVTNDSSASSHTATSGTFIASTDYLQFISTKAGPTPHNTLRVQNSGTATYLQASSGNAIHLTEWSTPGTLIPLACSKIGVNQAIGTEALEVNGNIKATNYKLPPLGEIQTVCTAIDQQVFHRITPGIYTGMNWAIYNDTIPSYAIDVLIPPSGANKVGINQNAGVEVLEVNGNIKSFGQLKCTQAKYTDYNQTITSDLTGTLLDNDSNNLTLTLESDANKRIDIRNVVDTTLAYYGCLGNSADLNPGSISWKDGNVGINIKPGAYNLEVNGTSKLTGVVTLGSNLYTQPNSPIEMTATANSDQVGFVVTPASYTGCTWYVYDASTSNYAISALTPHTTGGACKVGINQEYGTDVLEVAGNIKAWGQQKCSQAKYTDYNETITSDLTGTLADNDSNMLTLTLASDAGKRVDMRNVLNTGLTYYGCLANSGDINPGSIAWKDGCVGINRLPGTDALDVNGNIKYSGSLIAPDATALTSITVKDSSNSFTIDSANTDGIFQKLGRWCYFNLKVTWTDRGSATGNLIILASNLPVFTKNCVISIAGDTGKGYVYGLSSTSANPEGFVSLYYYDGSNNSVNLLATDLPASGRLWVTGMSYV